MSAITKTVRPQNSTARWLQNELRREIIEMELAPGVRLSEQELASRFSVSRQPVREAMISLANDNLVDIKPQRGTFVSHLSLERMHESRLMREAIEVMIVEQACRHFDEQLFPKIRTCIEIQRVRAEAGDRSAFQASDEEFHELLAHGAGFPHAWETIQNLKQHTDRLCKLTLSSTAILLDLADQHKNILDAIQQKKSLVATDLMRQHLSGILQKLPDIKRQYPEWFNQIASL
jgi:GntR family transcriptional regulator, rspAB operon transcriptional repressor